MYACVYIYIYIYTYVMYFNVHVYVHVYNTYIYRERERESERHIHDTHDSDRAPMTVTERPLWTIRHHTRPFRKRATSELAEGPAYGLDFSRYIHAG